MKDNPDATLREAFRQFAEGNEAEFSTRDATSEASEFFRCHDVAHVVFACDTSLFGEGVLKIFTIWGTSLGLLGHLRGYSEADAFSLFRQYSTGHLARHIGKFLVAIPGTILRARRMSKPWPWADHAEYMDMQVKDIRREFNIQV